MKRRSREISSRKTARDGAEVSLRRPTLSQERMRKKRRPAPFEMTEAGWVHLGGRLGGTPEGAEADFIAAEIVAVAHAGAGDGMGLKAGGGTAVVAHGPG